MNSCLIPYDFTILPNFDIAATPFPKSIAFDAHYRLVIVICAKSKCTIYLYKIFDRETY